MVLSPTLEAAATAEHGNSAAGAAVHGGGVGAGGGAGSAAGSAAAGSAVVAAAVGTSDESVKAHGAAHARAAVALVRHV